MPANQTVAQLKQELANLQTKLSSLEEDSKPTKEKAVKTLFRWQSFSRPYSKRGPKWFVYTSLLVLTILLILLFVKEFFIILPVLAVAFLGYVLMSVPPEIIDNAVTTHGINTADRSYIWEELDDFWFVEKNGFYSLYVDTFLRWPRRLFILINKDDKEKLKDTLARYLPYRELPKTTWMDTASDSLSNAFHKLTA